MVKLNVNGATHDLDIDPATPLLYALREDLKLNGPKFGCGLGQCGACTVNVDGKAAFSCQLPVMTLQGREVLTVEGLARGAKLHPLQQAFADEQAAQCGYCTSGMIMRAHALLAQNTSPSVDEIRDHMQPNLCRCGTHMRILRAVRRAARS